MTSSIPDYVKESRWLLPLLCLALSGVPGQTAAGGETGTVWQPLPGIPEGGVFGERMALWREGRLWHMLEAEDGYLLSGFESRPGTHPWQGEDLGKWLHAATLAHQQTGDEQLLKAMQEAVRRLLATQEENGYLGTYGPDTRFTAMPENVALEEIADDIAPVTKGKRRNTGWDTWTFRYNLYGLLVYDRYHPEPRVVEACRKMADLLIEVYGEGKYDLTLYVSVLNFSPYRRGAQSDRLAGRLEHEGSRNGAEPGASSTCDLSRWSSRSRWGLA